MALSRCESAPGAGTTFRIYFPAVAEPRAEALPEPAAPGSARGSGQHVLYVDDDEAMVFLVTRMLEGLGYRVSGYERATEALAAVRAAPGILTWWLRTSTCRGCPDSMWRKSLRA